MATVQRRRKNIIASRRPVAEEGEEGGEDYSNELDDSLSDDSYLSEEEEEEDEDEDDEDYSEDEEEEKKKESALAKETANTTGQITIQRPPPKEATTNSKTNETVPKATPAASKSNGTAKLPPRTGGAGRADTEFMIKGLKIDEQLEEEEAVDFDDLDDQGVVPNKKPPTPAVQSKPTILTNTRPSEKPKEQQPVRHESPFERRRREHEEYKKKRDADPAFVPNRGAFFMHDQRHYGGGGGSGFKQFARGGRGGGRGGMFGRGIGFGRDGPEPVETTWKHDGFEELLAAERPKVNPPQPPQPPRPPNPPKQETTRKLPQVNERPTIQIVVNLPGMKLPITFNEVPHRTHLRLPYHRPPLRRDKPVRISMPEQPIKYVFPNHNRSFIFIPRAMRPSAPAFVGGGVQSAVKRGGLHRNSTRSIYAGSTQSAAMSRKSSSQPDNNTQPASPTAAPAITNQPVVSSSQPNLEALTVPAQREVKSGPSEQSTVKLPPNQPLSKPLTNVNNQASNSNTTTTTTTIPTNTDTTTATNSIKNNFPSPANKATIPVSIKPSPSYPTPVPPIHDARGTPIIPMHQPRPQKTVSVADIETPVSAMHYSTNPYISQQPQGYVDMTNGAETPTNYPNNIYTHSRHPSYQSQPPSTHTPLSQLPDRAVHAQPFQPQSAAAAAVYSAPYGTATHYYPSPQAPAHAHPTHHHQHPTMYHQPPPAYSASPQYVASSLANTTPAGYQSVPVGAQGQTIAQESGGTVYFYDPGTYYAAYVAAQGGYGQPLTPAPETGGIGVPSGGTVYYYPTPGTVYYQ